MRRQATNRRGIATMLVLSVIGFVAVLGIAMLAGASLQVQTAANTSMGVGAEALAESGVDLALYYLSHPLRAPGNNALGYWAGATGITLGAAVPGTVDVAVSALGSNIYAITTTGRVPGRAGCAVGRRALCTAYATGGFPVKRGAAFNTGTLNLPAGSVVNGDFQVNGKLNNYGTITGTAYIQQLGVAGNLGGWQLLTSENATPIPNSTVVRDYSTYTYRGQTYNAVVLTDDNLWGGTVLGPTSSNPAGIFWRDGKLDLNGNVTINGTLLVSGGPVNVNTGNTVITAAEGFPAAVLQGDLFLKGTGSSRSLTANGLTYLKGNMRTSSAATGGNLNFNGAILVQGTVVLPFAGKVNVTYDLDKVSEVNLDTTVAPATVKIRSFSK